MTIQQLQALDMSKVQPEALAKAVTDILEDYKATTDKTAFEKIAKENIEKVFLLVQRLAPASIKKEKLPKTAPKNSGNKNTTSKKKNAKEGKVTLNKALEELNADIKACRVKIRKFNEERRKNAPKKPKPTRHSKIKKHFIAIANLVPPAHKENPEVQKAAEKVLLKAHRGIMNAYKMNTIRAEANEKAIKKKYSALKD